MDSTVCWLNPANRNRLPFLPNLSPAHQKRCTQAQGLYLVIQKACTESLIDFCTSRPQRCAAALCSQQDQCAGK